MTNEIVKQNKPRVYLFHGNDNNSSLQAVLKWQKLFISKYPEGNLVFLDCLEINNADLLIEKFKELISGQSLFSSMQIIIIKDIYFLKKNSSVSLWKRIEDLIKETISNFDQDLTLVFWERRLLNSKDGMYKYFQLLEVDGFSKIQLYNLENNSFDKVLKNELNNIDRLISKEAYIWLKQQYNIIGSNLKKEEGLKNDQSLVQDERIWWLKNTITNCQNYSLNPELQLDDFKLSGNLIEESFGSFDLVNALQNNDFDKAWKVVRSYIDLKIDISSIYLIFGALRWMMRQKIQDQKQSFYGLKLLGQIEIFAKNGISGEYDLLILFMINWEKYLKNGESNDLLDLRKVWLSSLPRSLV